MLEGRGVFTEMPIPSEGYLGSDDFYTRSIDEDLVNECAIVALRGVIYTERIGRCMSADAFICRVHWEEEERICACR